jgi:hypothetical protein
MDLIKVVIKEELILEKRRRKKKVKRDACYYKVRSRYDVWPSAYASGALSKCRKVGADNWGNSTKESEEHIDEKWSEKYKKSVDCNNPKGFSQRAHCQGRKKNEETFNIDELITEKRKLTSKPGSESNLRDWFKRKGAKGSTGGWVDCNTCRKDKETGRTKCKPCGRQEGEKRSKYPACRPTPGSCKKYKSSKGKSWGKKAKNESISESLLYHLENNIPLNENVYRYGSEGYFNLINETRELYLKGLIELNEEDTEFIKTDIGKKGIFNGEEVWLDIFYEEEIEEKVNEANIEKIKSSCRNKIKTETERSGKPFPSAEASGKIAKCIKDGSGDNSSKLNEAEYQGKKVQLNKPKRGGSKKFYVYTKCGDRVRKISFGAKSGGGNLAVKLRNPKARKAFSDRHKCPQKNDKCSAGYWACRLPRYAKSLGLSGGGTWW